MNSKWFGLGLMVLMAAVMVMLVRGGYVGKPGVSAASTNTVEQVSALAAPAVAQPTYAQEFQRKLEERTMVRLSDALRVGDAQAAAGYAAALRLLRETPVAPVGGLAKQ